MMKLLQKLIKANKSDRFLLIEAATLLIFMRVGLKFTQFKTLRNQLIKLSQPKNTQQVSIYKIVWAITMVSLSIPGVKCLARAMVTQVMLSRRGYPNQLRIGVPKNKRNQFIAHAWVESRGRTVMGGLGNMAKYYSIMSLPEWEQLHPPASYSFAE